MITDEFCWFRTHDGFEGISGIPPAFSHALRGLDMVLNLVGFFLLPIDHHQFHRKIEVAINLLGIPLMSGANVFELKNKVIPECAIQPEVGIFTFKDLKNTTDQRKKSGLSTPFFLREKIRHRFDRS